MTKPKIRIADIADAPVLIDFNIRMARETEDLELSFELISNGVLNMINKPGHGFYIVAEIDEKIVGSLMITTEWSDWRNGFFWWIQSVYVEPGSRRMGIYREMYSYIKTIAQEDKLVCGFRLYVEENNTTAKAVYETLGMKKTHYLLFEELKF